MQPISRKEFNDIRNSNIYWSGRWEYIKWIIRWSMEIGCQRILEIGPSYAAFFHDSDLMDIRQECYRSIDIVHNCCNVPWPLDTKSYDTIIAAQVWEHLKYPGRAFEEAKRVSKNIILVLPYRWTPKSGHSREHWRIDENKILEWTKMEPSHCMIVTTPSKKRKRGLRRIICRYGVGGR